MARPRKATVDYFPHYCNHGDTIKILEGRYKNNGYAFWFKLLEKIGKTDGHYLDLKDELKLEILSVETGVSTVETREILDLLSRLDAIDSDLWTNHMVVWCQKFVDNVSDSYRLRKSDVPQKPVYSVGNEVSNVINEVSNVNITSEIHKLNKTKLNKIKENNIYVQNEFAQVDDVKKSKLKKPNNGYSPEFETFWKTIIHRPLDRKADAWTHWKRQKNIPPIHDLLPIVEKYNQAKANTDPEHLLATYNWIKNQLYLPENSVNHEDEKLKRWLES